MSLEIRIDKRLGRFRLAVNIAASDGCLGVLGASGSGKSMILKCVAGIETPDRGRIAVNGRTLYDSDAGINLRPQQRRVGYLFQNYALFPFMTVADNIGIGIRASDADKRRRVESWLSRFRLAGMGGRYPDQLSGGQQQRAALARMLAAEPEVILLDEPFSALDAHLREHMQLEMKSVIEESRDVVLVTHNRDEAYRLGTHLMVLDNGRVLGMGGTRAMFADPKHVDIARITGCKNISRIEAIGGAHLRAVDWGVDLRTAGPVPADARFIGIRAHDFLPVADGDGSDENTIAMRVVGRTEDLFEWNVIFTNANAAGGGEIWWKYSKYALGTFPSRLRFPPEALMFLADG